MTLKEMLEKRAKLITDARAAREKVAGEKRDLTTEEATNIDKMLDDAITLKADIDKLEKDEKRDATLKAEEADLNERRGRRSSPSDPNAGGKRDEVRTLEWKDAYGGKRSIRVAPNSTNSNEDYEKRFNGYLAYGAANGLITVNVDLTDEERALQADLPAAGGYIMTPPMFTAQFIQAMDNETFVRRLATILPPGNGVGAPSLDADPADPTWISELDTGALDTTMVFGKRELKPHVLAQAIKVSKTLLRAGGTVIDADAKVRERLAYKGGVVMEAAYLLGHGGGQPLGVFTASTNGISTGRDVSTGNTSTSITVDGLKEAKWTLKPQYHSKAQWIFHRDAIKQIDKLKDGNGQYLWQPSIVQGIPDRVLNFPVNLSEYAPNTFTSGLYVGILGDFSKYWIQDSLNMTIQVVLELYAATNQNGYFSRFESDGMPTIEEAFTRVKLG
jgi:HK97 family phage major capsid protein